MELTHQTGDKEIVEEYKKRDCWGMSAAVDLKNCNTAYIRDAGKIRQFVDELCQFLGIKKFGPTTIVDFGENERVSGFSMTQLIETSLISGHFANQSNAVYLDIFSCKEYPPRAAAEFCKEFFEAESYNVQVSFRV